MPSLRRPAWLLPLLLLACQASGTLPWLPNDALAGAKSMLLTPAKGDPLLWDLEQEPPPFRFALDEQEDPRLSAQLFRCDAALIQRARSSPDLCVPRTQRQLQIDPFAPDPRWEVVTEPVEPDSCSRCGDVLLSLVKSVSLPSVPPEVIPDLIALDGESFLITVNRPEEATLVAFRVDLNSATLISVPTSTSAYRSFPQAYWREPGGRLWSASERALYTNVLNGEVLEATTAPGSEGLARGGLMRIAVSAQHPEEMIVFSASGHVDRYRPASERIERLQDAPAGPFMGNTVSWAPLDGGGLVLVGPGQKLNSSTSDLKEVTIYQAGALHTLPLGEMRGAAYIPGVGTLVAGSSAEVAAIEPDGRNFRIVHTGLELLKIRHLLSSHGGMLSARYRGTLQWFFPPNVLCPAQPGLELAGDVGAMVELSPNLIAVVRDDLRTDFLEPVELSSECALPP